MTDIQLVVEFISQYIQLQYEIQMQEYSARFTTVFVYKIECNSNKRNNGIDLEWYFLVNYEAK